MQKTNYSKLVAKMQNSIPIFLLKELKKSNKPIKVRGNYHSKDLERLISKDIEGVEQGFINDEKLNKVYEGIIDIKQLEDEVILFFKNSVDNTLVSDMFMPYQIKQLNFLVNQQTNVDIIAMTFKKNK